MAWPKHLFVGLTGPANVGKDTVAQLLETHCGFRALAFSDPLYAEISQAFSIDVRSLKLRATKEQPIPQLALVNCKDLMFRRCIEALLEREADGDRPAGVLTAPRSPRRILQWWGTEYRRKWLGDDAYWIRHAHGRISLMLRERLAHRIVLTDCRYQNEVDFLRNDYAAEIWQIVRPVPTATLTGHDSEVEGDQFRPNVVLHNVHTVRHLQGLVLGEVLRLESGLKVRVEVEDAA